MIATFRLKPDATQWRATSEPADRRTVLLSSVAQRLHLKATGTLGPS